MPPKPIELQSRGKYARLDDATDDDTPLRESFDSNASSLEDVESYDPLNYDAGTLKRKPSKNSLRARKASFKDAEIAGTKTTTSKRRRWAPSKLCCGLIVVFAAAAVLLLSAGGIWVYSWNAPSAYGQSPPWYPSPKGGTDPAWAESYKKAAAMVKKMTLVEKVNVTTGTGWSMDMCVGNTGAVPRLQFPSLCLQDGPLGIRFADHITAFPAGLTVGATWNRELMYQRGRALGKENRLKGVHVLLGPSMGPLGRMPAGGRNWEGFGSDPVLQGVAAAETIKGIQDEGVIATAKHWVGNEQEHFRQAWAWGPPNALSSNIDDRTLHEIYAWPFADSVRAGVASVMCAYNQVNNSYACQNSKLMNGVLKDELGFQGFVQSDWLAQRGGVASALAGLDMTMPGDGLKWQDGKSLWGGSLTTAVLNGSVPVERLDDMATRVVAAWYQVGQDDRKKWPSIDGTPNFSSFTNNKTGKLHWAAPESESGVVNQFVDVQGEGENAHNKLVRRIAAEGTVLVKNDDNILPLDRNGRNNDVKSSKSNFRVGVFGEDARLSKDGINHCADQGCNDGTLASGWGSGAVNFPYLVEPISALRDAFNQDTVEVAEWLENTPPSKDFLLEDQDVCIVFVNSDAGEGYMHWNGIRGDRNDLHLQNGGDKLIHSVAQRCGGPVIVVIHTVGPIIMEPWIDRPNIKAVLIAHLPGQESGNALVDVLFGVLNPSGRLPYTITKSADDFGPTSKIKYLPDPRDGMTPQQNFSEGLYIDYRYLDKNKIEPRYEFGYGLSYTTFKLEDLTIKEEVPRESLSALPAARQKGIEPPTYETKIPDPKTALFPPGFKKLTGYIYPWISSIDKIEKPSPNSNPYTVIPTSTPSEAGGAQGGNPDLYTTILTVSATLSNTGPRDGDCVVQLYIEFPAGYRDDVTGEVVDFPVRVLRGFEKVSVKSAKSGDAGKGKGEKKTVEFKITRKDLSYWDVRRQNWVLPRVEKGEFGIAVGFSSRDLVLRRKW